MADKSVTYFRTVQNDALNTEVKIVAGKAADALDAKDAEIKRLRERLRRWEGPHYIGGSGAWGGD